MHRALFWLVPSLVLCWSEPARPTEAAFVFTNGVWQTEANAQRSATALGERIRSFFNLSEAEFDARFTVRLAYNTTRCPSQDLEPLCLLDIYESLVQKRGLSNRSFWRIVNRLEGTATAERIVVSEFAQSTVPVAPDTLTITEADLVIHLNLYRELLALGNKVIILPHSQGNFFANFAYDILDDREATSVGIVSVATPASSVAGDGPHLTLVEDFIHFVPGALFPNTSNGECGTSFDCHAFVGSYLNGLVSGPQMLALVEGQLNSLEPPLPPEPPTPVSVDVHPTFTLTSYDSVDLRWGSNNDEDFAVYRIYRAVHPNVSEEDELVAELTDQQFKFYRDNGGFVADTDYFYRVFVMDDTGLSSGSNEVRTKRFSAEVPDTRVPNPGDGGFPGEVLVPAAAINQNWFVCTSVHPVTLACLGSFVVAGPVMNSTGAILRQRFYSLPIEVDFIAGQAEPLIILLPRETFQVSFTAVDQSYTVRLPSYGLSSAIPAGGTRLVAGMAGNPGSFSWTLESLTAVRQPAMVLGVLP